MWKITPAEENCFHKHMKLFSVKGIQFPVLETNFRALLLMTIVLQLADNQIKCVTAMWKIITGKGNHFHKFKA